MSNQSEQAKQVRAKIETQKGLLAATEAELVGQRGVIPDALHIILPIFVEQLEIMEQLFAVAYPYPTD